MIESIEHELEKRIERRNPYFEKRMRLLVNEAAVIDPLGHLQGYSHDVLTHPVASVTIGGNLMEKTIEQLNLVREEMQRNKEALEKMVNDMRALSDVVTSCLAKEIQNIRDSRFALQRESGDALTTLRDVRKFFLEGEYKEEMERLERFIHAARGLKALLDDGTLNAVSDVMLKLSERPGVSL